MRFGWFSEVALVSSANWLATLAKLRTILCFVGAVNGWKSS